MDREIIVSNRSVYHKYTQIKVKVPNDVKDADVNAWLQDNEDKWKDDMDKKVSKTEYEFGLGLEPHGMCQGNSESEWRYDVLVGGKQSTGGHL